jgi:dihydrofolate reductase
MRKVRLGMNVSLDGFVAGPHGELDWIFRTMDPAQMESVTEFLHGVDTVLIGHVTYLEQAATWPNQSGELADLLNSHAKVVFSSRLETLAWNNSRLATGSPAEEVARLKQQPGKDIYVTGGATLAQSLSRLGLIDEYNLTIRPVVLGSGMPLFKDMAEPLNLALTSTRTYDTGAVALTYQLAETEDE